MIDEPELTPAPIHDDVPKGIRLYAPPIGAVRLIVTREAESLAVDPDAPIAEANARSFSALAEDAGPVTDEERAYLDSLPQPDPEQTALMVAALKARSPR